MGIKLTSLGNILALFVLAGSLTVSCVESYVPKVDRYENLLVVDGNITDQPGPYTVSLSLSSSVNQPEMTPISDCEVRIESDGGEIEFLSETDVGIYTTKADGIQGKAGRAYRIYIRTPDGREYGSPYSILKSSIKIDSLYAVEETHQDQAYTYPLEGIQFYINTGNSQVDTNYFLWQLEKTYKFQSDYLIKLYYDGSLKRFPKPDSFYTCWRSANIKDIYTESTFGLSQSKLQGVPLNYVSSETRELSVRYSLLVKQYTLDEAAYLYWYRLKDQNIEEGALYTQQPYQIRGNIKNLAYDDEPVLGYFMVAGLSSKRIYISRPSLIFNYSFCTLGEGDFDAFGYIGWTDKRTWPLYVAMNPDGRYGLPDQSCLDCTQKGGSIEKPDFWED